MSDDAKSLLFWIGLYQFKGIADYRNDYERECARAWAAYIIGAGL